MKALYMMYKTEMTICQTLLLGARRPIACFLFMAMMAWPSLSFAQLWAPSNIVTVAWYDASDGATLTTNVSGAVSQWRDKSGNSFHGGLTVYTLNC